MKRAGVCKHKLVSGNKQLRRADHGAQLLFDASLAVITKVLFFPDSI
jgi:hypothetical protein